MDTILVNICKQIGRSRHLSILNLAVVGGSTVDELFIALCCTSIAAPVPEIYSLKVRKYAQCNYEKTAHNPSVIVSINMVTM